MFKGLNISGQKAQPTICYFITKSWFHLDMLQYSVLQNLSKLDSIELEDISTYFYFTAHLIN